MLRAANARRSEACGFARPHRRGLARVGVAVLMLGSLGAGRAAAADDTGRAEDRKEWIRTLLQKDLMYGSDDFFGEDADLSYVDGIAPASPAVAPAPETPGTPTPTEPPVVTPPEPEPPPAPEPPPEEEPPPV